MTNTTRQALLHKSRRRPTPRKQGKKEDDIVNLVQKTKFKGKRMLQNCRKSTCDRRTGQVEVHVRVFKSPRIQDRGFYRKYVDKDDGLEHFIAYCGKAISHGDKYNNDDDINNNSDASDNDDDDDDNATWKYTNAHRDGDWIPKSYEKDRMHDDDDNHDNTFCNKHAHGGHHFHSDDNHDDDDNNDHDNVISSKHAYDGDHTHDETVDDCWHHSNDNNDPEATQTYHDSADEGSMIHIDDDDPQTDNVGYVRRKRRSMNSLLKSCNKRSSSRKGSKWSLSSVRLATPQWSKGAAILPSWKNKKPRVVCKKQAKVSKELTNAQANELENGRCDAHEHCRSNTTVQETQRHATYNNVCTSQVWQCKRQHVTAMSRRQGEAPLPTHPNSPVVSLSSVLEYLPKELTESELTTLRGDDGNKNQPSNTTGSAKRPSTQQTHQEMTDDSIEKERGRVTMGKPKRKKHRPKVQQDISLKTKRAPKNIKRKACAREGDSLKTEGQKNVRKKRQAKKGQDMGDSTSGSSTTLKKCGHLQGQVSAANAGGASEDNHPGTRCLHSFHGESSIIPFQLYYEDIQNVSSQNLMVREVACLHDLLARKNELSMYMHMSEAHNINFTPELINSTPGDKLALYGHFLGQVPHYIYESRLPSPLNSTDELITGLNKLSLVHSEPDSSAQLLLVQAPHNQLELVLYNQRREMVVSKSTKSRVKIRAKVQLDPENERMWPLLILGGIPTDFEDVIYWERERAIMEKHVSQFIHNMQSVQGDRHFSQWKGSILDSVVGAFLTQNVSDHLSSSAFMSVAARYPSNGRTNTKNTKETLNRENEYALEMSKIPLEIKSDTRDMYKTSCGSVDEASSKQQKHINVHLLDGCERMTSTCEITINYTQQIKPCSSLRGVKSILRNNGASQPVEIRDIENKSDSITPIRTPICVLTDEDNANQSGMQHLNRTFKEKLQHSDNSTSTLNHTNSTPTDYAEQSSMHHLDSVSPCSIEVNILIEPSVDHDNNIRLDYTGQSGSENTSFNYPTEDDDTTKKSMMSHNGITADHTGQSGMQNLEKASSQLDTSMKSCSYSISDLGHHNGTSAERTGQSGIQHPENPSQGLMEEAIENDPSNISTSSLGSPYNYTGQVSHQLLDRAFPCSMEEDISTNQNDPHGKSIIAKHDLCDDDDSCKELSDKEKLCSSSRTDEVNCDCESVKSASLKTRGLVDGSNTNTLLKEIGPSIAETPSLKQCTTDRSWRSPDPRTEVYSKSTVCRSLFKNHVTLQMNSDTTTLLNSDNNEQASNNFETSQTENHLAVIEESKQMACGSALLHEVIAPSPVSTIVGNKRRHALSGIERAHLEENQHGRKKNHTQDWESVRRRTIESCSSNDNTFKENLAKDTYQDSVDWDAVRRASVEDLAETIKERGMHHVLSGRIKAFLKTLHEEQGSLDLEWLRKVSPENAKAYLTGIRGLGVKSVECIRLLTLHHVAFPVDVNVGRICVRLGWVPIEPLPEQLQLHLLELYPVQETIQKFLWPRLCMLDQKTLYELHYQLITFGKVFCTKSKPNCNACPMRTDCKHFASAYASSKLLLTGSNDEPSKRLCSGTAIPALMSSYMDMEGKTMTENVEGKFAPQVLEKDYNTTISYSKCQPYFVEEPASPEATDEPEIEQEISDIEDFPYIYGNLNDFTEDLLQVSELPYESINSLSSYTHTLTKKNCEEGTNSVDAQIEASCITTADSYCNSTEDQFNSNCTLSAMSSALASCSSYESNNPSLENFPSYESVVEEEESDGRADVREGATNALISLPEGAYIPAPKLKNIDRLRTVHYVYELPDDHPLLEHADVREKDDPSFYLLAIWSPGEAPDSLSGIDDQQEDLCRFSSANADETVSGTLLIPCRTAMRGSFPLNGTYFQVNEVFADHASSLRPFQVPRSHIWSLQRRFVYFGTSVSNIFRGLTMDEIKSCFLRGYVCVRGFDRKYKTPRPLVCRLHFPISKQIQRHKKEVTGASCKD